MNETAKSAFKIAAYALAIMLIVHSPFAAQNTENLSASQNLGCTEFKSMFAFVGNRHLRFQLINETEKNKLLTDAYVKMPDTLRVMGYPMMAAKFSSVIQKNAELNLPLGDLNQICHSLKSTLYRAAFLKSYMRNLDPYSDFFTSEELDVKTASLEGEFIGVGIGTEPHDKYLRVTEIVENGPASEKLKINDLIEKIDGHEVSGLSENEVRQRIRGPKGSSVTFSFIRATEQHEISLVRNQIHQKSITTAWSDNQFLTIRVHRFFRQTAQEVEAALRENLKQTKGIILDLRNNPGGLLQAARDLVDLFVSQGVVVYLRGRDFEDQVWALRDGTSTQVPMVILVNSETASAAEIVAGALQDYGRAIVVGQKTYGKGCVQNIYEAQSAVGTSYRGGLKLTTLWYYLPSGRSVRSLMPDISIATPHQPLLHPVMPYLGPDRIDTARESKLLAKNKYTLKHPKNRFKNSQDYELVGKTLLKDMQAHR